MAMTEITKTALAFGTAAAMPEGSAVDASDGAYVAYDKNDGGTVLILSNTGESSATVTVKKGDSVMAAGSDLGITLAASAQKLLCLESGRYLVTSGVNKGRVLISASAAGVKIAAAVLPE